jgi:hypothetical protein
MGPIHVLCFASLFLLDLITLIIFGEGHKLRSCTLCTLFCLLVMSSLSLSHLNAILVSFFSKHPELCPSFRVEGNPMWKYKYCAMLGSLISSDHRMNNVRVLDLSDHQLYVLRHWRRRSDLYFFLFTIPITRNYIHSQLFLTLCHIHTAYNHTRS